MPQSASRTSAAAPAKVLIIDDDPVLLDLMTSAFRAAGYQTRAAENGRKGLELLDGYGPDLVITDIVMPEMEGIGAIMAIKRKPRPPKVIAISGVGRLRYGDYLTWASHLGADEVLAKPFKMSDILKLARSVIDN
jgi:CheY-like chemotaxis protein